MAKAKVEWTKEMEIKLIELVKPHENLWDSRSKNYLKNREKYCKYMELCEALKRLYPSHAELFSYDRLLTKFNILKKSYRREWVRQQNGPKNYHSCWEHYHRMKFIPVYPNVEKNRGKRTTSFFEEGELVEVKDLCDDDFTSFTNNEGQSIQPYTKRQKTSDDYPQTKKVTDEQEALGIFLGARLFSIKDVSERHCCLLEILNTIHAYELRQIEREIE